MTHVVAIDGPSGAGKGTVARAVALALGWAHIDTGAMYRAVAWRVQQRGHSLDDEHQVTEVVATASFVLESDRVMIDTYDVTSAIRTPEMDVAAATVARMPAVRAALVARQREYATSGPLVMEGRDISTVVFSRRNCEDFSGCHTRRARQASSQGPDPWILADRRD